MNLFKIITLSFSGVMLAGCGALYNETRDKQAQDLRTSFEKVDFLKAIEENKERRSEIYAEQVNVVRALKDQQLKRNANQLVGGGDPNITVENQILRLENAGDAEKIFGKISGDFTNRQAGRKARGESIQEIKKLQLSVATTRGVIKNLQSTIEMVGFPAPDCSEFLPSDKTDGALANEIEKWIKISKNPSDRAKILKPTLDSLRSECIASKTVEQDLTEKLKSFGELKSAISMVELQEAQLLKMRQEAKTLVASYEAAEGELKSAAKSASDQSLLAAQKKIKDARNNVYKSGNSFAIWAISRLNVAKIDAVLSEVENFDPEKTTDTPLSEDAKSIIFVLHMREAITSNSEKAAPWNALAIRRDIEKEQSDTAARDIRSQSKIIDLARAELHLKTLYLVDIGTFGDQISRKPGSDLNKTIAFLLYGSPPSAKPNNAQLLEENTLRRDLYKYLSDILVTNHRYERDKALIGIERARLDYEKSVSYSQVSYAQWATLLNATVASLEASSKAGWRKEEINSFIQTLLLGGIVKGTN